MKVDREGDLVKFEYRHDSRYIRRVVSMAELTEFLEGGRRQESNLPEGRLPVKFIDFVTETHHRRPAEVDAPEVVGATT